MTPAELTDAVQLFLDRYIVGAAQDAADPTVPVFGPGIRRRTPAVVSIPPEYAPQPNGLDNTRSTNGNGPEAFDDPVALYLDCCPLERALVTPTADGVSINFLFVVRYAAREFDPSIGLPVCLPSGYELAAIVSECCNKVLEFLGVDDASSSTPASSFPALTTTLEILTFDDFLRRELPNVSPN